MRNLSAFAGIGLILTIVLPIIAADPDDARDISSNRCADDLSGRAGSGKLFKAYIPAGTSRLTITTSGGEGYCDLYVRHAYWPTLKDYDARSAGKGTQERISIRDPQSGWWGILVQADRAYEGVTLRVQIDAGGDDGGPIEVPGKVVRLDGEGVLKNISGERGELKYFRVAVPRGIDRLTISTSGGSGDCDLYVRHGDLPASGVYDGRSTGGSTNESVSIDNPAGGEWYILIHGFRDYSDVSLKVSFGRDRQAECAITSPTGGERWQLGRSYTISWTCPGSVRNIQIQYSTDNGNSWSLAGLPRSIRADRGSISWDLPDDADLLSSSARIRMVDVDERTVLAISGMFAVARRGGNDNRRDAYEPDNDRDKAGSIGLRSPQLHSIFPDEDVDWIAFQPDRDGTYEFSFTDVTIPLKGELWIRKSSGKEDRIEKFKLDKSGGSVRFNVAGPIDAVIIKVQAQDDDDKGIYTVTVVRSQVWVR